MSCKYKKKQCLKKIKWNSLLDYHYQNLIYLVKIWKVLKNLPTGYSGEESWDLRFWRYVVHCGCRSAPRKRRRSPGLPCVPVTAKLSCTPFSSLFSLTGRPMSVLQCHCSQGTSLLPSVHNPSHHCWYECLLMWNTTADDRNLYYILESIVNLFGSVTEIGGRYLTRWKEVWDQ